MALSQIPPWLDVRPSDFVKAAQMGAEAGLAVSRMNQAASEAAANRAQRGAEHQAELELRQLERQMQMEMRAEELAARREASREALEARTQYNLSNLGLREREAAAREEIARENLGFRQASETRLQAGADLAAQREKRLADQERRLAASKISPEVQAQVKLLTTDYSNLAKSHALETDPQMKAQLAMELQGIKQQILDLMPKPEAVGGAPAGPGGDFRPPDWATAPAGMPVAPGMGFQPGMPPEEGLFGGTAGAPELPAPATRAPLPPPPAAAAISAPDETGWKTNRLGIRYRLASPTAEAPAGEEEEPIWPDQEEEPE